MSYDLRVRKKPSTGDHGAQLEKNYFYFIFFFWSRYLSFFGNTLHYACAFSKFNIYCFTFKFSNSRFFQKIVFLRSLYLDYCNF